LTFYLETEHTRSTSGQESTTSHGGDGTLGYKRRTFSVAEKTKTTSEDSHPATSITNTAITNIREKLAAKGKLSKKQAKVLERDPDIVSSIQMPTFVSHRVGAGISDDEVHKAQEEHSRKLMGWKYHIASKAQDEKNLESKRRRQNEN